MLTNVLNNMPTNPSDRIRSSRTDLSPYLFHFTKGKDPIAVLNTIIEEHKLKSSRGYICFTETPLTSNIKMFELMANWRNPILSPYGIGFKRDFLFSMGARPVIYSTEEENRLIPDELQWRCLNLNPQSYDFSWLREWRIKGNEFDFSTISRDIIIIAQKEEELSYLTSEYEYEVDYSYEHELGIAIPFVLEITKKIYRGVSIAKINSKEYTSDLQIEESVSYQTKNDTL